MKVTHDGEYFSLRVKWSEIVAACEGLSDEDFRDGFLHLADVAFQNSDAHGVELVANAVGAQEEAVLPAEIRKSLQMLLTEAMAVGKEITLRKLARTFDPNGEFIEVPDDWIGKGPGPNA